MDQLKRLFDATQGERERELLINFVNEMQIHAALWGGETKRSRLWETHACVCACTRTFFFKHVL